ncbi:hypothetical protein ASD54_01665 [Rhizobium sp. Root149]|uniref:FRG domain-containing protein n=1 Tax=Rhizobium sp. Root149 TaxID=1736473 RepID=UPI0007134479|nr:FRG domain-containing protein [Rhizobium sp. Root149]KQZ63116.1 hypothetical protein ASD54_01665 [Rhizobium sp. Root149]
MSSPLIPSPCWFKFIENVSGKTDRRWIFRGQADASWSLIPGVGRPEVKGKRSYRREDELRIFEEFKAEALCLHPDTSTDMELLALAQHHQLATRLLDWSTNPLVAAYFACQDEKNTVDARVHMIRTELTGIKLKSDFKPFDEDMADVVLVRVPPRTSRITAQQGVFSIHSHPVDAWQPDPARNKAIAQYETFNIPASEKPFFRAVLGIMGVDESRLMGGLDGIGRTLSRSYYNRFV